MTWNDNTEGYYISLDTLFLVPSPLNNYQMQQGYNYTFGLVMKTRLGSLNWNDGCPVGTVPFVISVVPDCLRWNPQSSDDNRWNNPNWLGINERNEVLHEDAHFAPLPTTSVIIPTPEEGQPYPVLPDKTNLSPADSVKQTHFSYNVCKVIRFMPGAAMGQQQRLVYDNAVVDMDIPQQKWALRTAPVDGMLSGDLFMADADLNNQTMPWKVGAFDANGRNHTTGNASFWLSLYSRETIHKGNNSSVKDTTYTASAEWSKVTNAMRYSLAPAQGWAVYTRTKSGSKAVLRLPKKGDIYYYYTTSGNIAWDLYESNLRDERAKNTGQADKVGKMVFYRVSRLQAIHTP